ncbi:MAG TPA: large conductance mechanosensitive channel protein MscL [Eubacteriales bacterium]|jgi:large conductance mechanosensitive channel|nr:large conductance mechanosensitive channel protein MscL [Clostridia bacterium]HRV72699.1 large conductance mechanosensitive channel protein MscL [Eubacteriales bacterium]
MWKDFKKFAFKGNVMDMAVGVIIATAFGKIVSSLVNDVFMPLIGLLVGGVNFNDMFIVLQKTDTVYETLAAAQEAGVPLLTYGTFIAAIIDFFIIAFVVFLLVRLVNKTKKKEPEPAPAPEPRLCPYCFGEINEKATRCPHCTSELK